MSSDIYRSRLSTPYGKGVADFVSSLQDDEWLLVEDIQGTEAHNIMLYENGILSVEELKNILSSLENVKKKFCEGHLIIEGDYEDIHEFIENLVIKETGLEVGGKLHTARSRNDQVALDIRLKTRREILKIGSLLLHLLEAILERVTKEVDTLLPLYTHTQQAQIGSFAHYLVAFFDAFLRDLDRIRLSFKHVNRNPLGACAVGGTRIPINRLRTTDLLGFDGLVENSLDAVSSRDFAVEVTSTLTLLCDSLSRMCGDFILWSSSEFNFVNIPDEYASTSSVMPHKKNPCILELIRARTSKIHGNLMQLLIILKGIPTGYNRDLQETKKPLRESFETVEDNLKMLREIILNIEMNRDRVNQVVEDSYALAVDMAEMLVVDYGLPFRKAHILVGHLVNHLIKNGKKLKDLDTQLIKEFSDKVLGFPLEVDTSKLNKTLDPKISLGMRTSIGSPSPKEVERMITSRMKTVKKIKSEIEGIASKLDEADKHLDETVKRYLKR